MVAPSKRRKTFICGTYKNLNVRMQDRAVIEENNFPLDKKMPIAAIFRQAYMCCVIWVRFNFTNQSLMLKSFVRHWECRQLLNPGPKHWVRVTMFNVLQVPRCNSSNDTYRFEQLAKVWKVTIKCINLIEFT